MKNALKTIGAVALSVLIGMASPRLVLAGDWVTTSHTVTIAVPDVLSISADTADFTLAFEGYVGINDESSAETVTYTVESNNMRQDDGAAAINANLDFEYDRIALKADVGTYTKTAGNTELVEAGSGFVTIGTSNVTLANKGNTEEGSDGKTLKGSLPITYKAVALADVPSGDQIHTLYVTLTTI